MECEAGTTHPGTVSAMTLCMNATNHKAPEFQSVSALVEFLVDDERETVTLAECGALARNIRTPGGRPASVAYARDAVLAFAAECGAPMALLVPQRKPDVRGFGANNHNRYCNNENAGGGGGSSLQGFAGQEG